MVGRRKPRGIDRSTPAWMITYGDMATLLLVFFVFLFSVSEVRQDKFKAAAGSLRAQIGVRPRHGSVVESRPPVETRRRDRREKERLGLPGTSDHVLAAAQDKEEDASHSAHGRPATGYRRLHPARGRSPHPAQLPLL